MDPQLEIRLIFFKERKAAVYIIQREIGTLKEMFQVRKRSPFGSRGNQACENEGTEDAAIIELCHIITGRYGGNLNPAFTVNNE